MSRSYTTYERGATEVDSAMKGTASYPAKRGSDGMTFCFVATWTNLFPSYSITHTRGGMESIGSEPVSLSTHTLQTFFSVQR